MQVPSVTEDDLQAFKARHFLKSSPKSSLYSNATKSNPCDLQNQASDEDDDGLGYYADGVKRTLTDEQIAIFRHTEISSLLRERQLLKERSESTDDTYWMKSPQSEVIKAGASIKSGNDAYHVSVNDDRNDEEEYTRFLDAERNNNKNSDGEKEDDHVNNSSFERDPMRILNGSKKRKKGEISKGGLRNKCPTHRRLARELDEAVVHDELLDYDEEPSKPKDASNDNAYGSLNMSRGQTETEPTDPFSMSGSGVRLVKEPASSGNGDVANDNIQLIKYRYKAIYMALKDWRKHISSDELSGPTNDDITGGNLFLSQACIEEIAKSASNLDRTEDFHLGFVHSDTELIKQHAEELDSLITKALADAKKLPVEGRKIWWPTIGK